MADDEVVHLPVTGYPTGDKWSMQGYNTGQFSHTLFVRAQIDEIPQSTPATPALIQID